MTESKMAGKVHALVLPKYGMVMTEGVLAAWHVEAGQEIKPGQEIVDIETEKIVNAYESQIGGILRRQVARAGDTLPVGALFAVVAEASVPEAEIDAFIEEFQRSFKPSDAAETGPSPQVVEAGGRRIRYLKTGTEEGAPVLLVHGFGGDLYNWSFNQEALSTKHPVYAIDLPGHGGSQKSVDDGAIGSLTKTVCDFLDALKLQRAHLIGHSLGGAIVLSVALDQPHRAQSLTLLSPVGLGQEVSAGFISGLIEADRRKDMKAVLEQLFSDPALVSREMVMNVLQAKRIDGAVKCLQAIAQRCFPGGKQAAQLRARLSGLRVPLQLIWGQEDQIIPVSHGAGLPANIAVHVLEGTGHVAHLERAREVNDLIQRFIHSN
jgi:pyruvate dehydrogenase E2 component (dihydrolipoamide acetyltransferase)